ncbi:hypothetical protein BU23DRAFT_491362 [Bimuria novae-zelandiae CBS 107.79]|uniref:Uncharacterized protein n=1 Tax=Bimuria novae-zelandiae CBS 107.79 TaxID=1447943 RepID=A0A6A5UKH2_9PLEO|nr:hypothetical protein BU23DRAFT_491362 [Bimuria novae-zelandiae CBS 107.79]
MRSSTILSLPVVIISASVIPTVSIDPSLIPDFGVTAGQDPNGSGSCAGANDILIPCFCPPDREEFIEKVNLAVTSRNFLGTPVTFDVDPLAQSEKDQFNRATTCLIVLQSFNGTRGVGCPAASAPTILDQQKHFANLLERDLSHGS